MKANPIREHQGILTTVEMLEHSAGNWGDKIALRIFRNGVYEETTYFEFADNVRKLAAGLLKLGVQPGDRISVLGENRPEWAYAYLAIHKAGGVGVPIDSLQEPSVFGNVITDADVKIVIASSKFVNDMNTVQEQLENKVTLICMDDEEHEGWMTLSQAMDAPIPETWPEVTLDDLAVIIYTSGTTGHSKGVMLTQNNLATDVTGCFQINIMGFEDTFLSVLPLHHTFECTGGFLVPLYCGASITYARSLKSRDIIEDVKNTKVTLILGVPLLFEKIMIGIQRKLRQAPPVQRALLNTLFGVEKAGSAFGARLGDKLFASLREKAGMSTLGLMISGGAALPPHVNEWFSKLGFNLIQGYGLTETSPVIHVSFPWDNNPTAVGPPLPGVEHKIIDADEDGNGEICVRGPMVMAGYYKNEEATREVIDEEGWFHTGDVGHIDEKDLLHITGRRKNLIVTTSGKNVYPEEVEDGINQSPWVLESLVIGKPLAHTTSEEVLCMVVPDKEYFEEQGTLRGKPYDDEEIRELVLNEAQNAVAKMADYKRPKQIEYRDEEFEKTSTKKIKRFLYKQSAPSA